MKRFILNVVFFLLIECAMVYCTLWNGEALMGYKLVLTGSYAHIAWQELVYGLWWIGAILLWLVFFCSSIYLLTTYVTPERIKLLISIDIDTTDSEELE